MSDPNIKRLLLASYIKAIEEKILLMGNIEDHGKVDCKKFAICDFGDDENKVIVDMKIHVASLRGSAERRSRALNEFRIISTRFLGHLTRLDQIYGKQNSGFKDKMRAINGETERRAKQKKSHDDKYLDLSKDLGYLTSYTSFNEARNNAVSGGNFLIGNNNFRLGQNTNKGGQSGTSKSNYHMQKLMNISHFRNVSMSERNQKIL